MASSGAFLSATQNRPHRANGRSVADSGNCFGRRLDRAPDWAKEQGVKIRAQPLVFVASARVVGVFDREILTEDEFAWLRTFADHAAVAISNARAFEELEGLRRRLELENSYLRNKSTRRSARRNYRHSPSLHPVTQTNQTCCADRHERTGARRIRHRQGTGRARDPRRQFTQKTARLIKVNCGAIPENLFESEFSAT